uniref:RRM domain-containing protein n=1 Tax=Spongospora subterranea TaxID=70186 RepID=A0A0H5R5Q2_9EUKA|eukprot:CRZ09485.1 hypothetical protein [Spongospora subterranea]
MNKLPSAMRTELPTLEQFLVTAGGSTSWADAVDEPEYYAEDEIVGDAVDSEPERAPLRRSMQTSPPFVAECHNLSFKCKPDDLVRFFAPSEIVNIEMPQAFNRPKGFAYVEFADVAGLDAALNRSGQQHLGRVVSIEVYRQQSRPPVRSHSSNGPLSRPPFHSRGPAPSQAPPAERPKLNLLKRQVEPEAVAVGIKASASASQLFGGGRTREEILKEKEQIAEAEKARALASPKKSEEIREERRHVPVVQGPLRSPPAKFSRPVHEVENKGNDQRRPNVEVSESSRPINPWGAQDRGSDKDSDAAGASKSAIHTQGRPNLEPVTSNTSRSNRPWGQQETRPTSVRSNEDKGSDPSRQNSRPSNEHQNRDNNSRGNRDHESSSGNSRPIKQWTTQQGHHGHSRHNHDEDPRRNHNGKPGNSNDHSKPLSKPVRGPRNLHWEPRQPAEQKSAQTSTDQHPSETPKDDEPNRALVQVQSLSIPSTPVSQPEQKSPSPRAAPSRKPSSSPKKTQDVVESPTKSANTPRSVEDQPSGDPSGFETSRRGKGRRPKRSTIPTRSATPTVESNRGRRPFSPTEFNLPPSSVSFSTNPYAGLATSDDDE